jgi:hypothetical protein
MQCFAQERRSNLPIETLGLVVPIDKRWDGRFLADPSQFTGYIHSEKNDSVAIPVGYQFQRQSGRDMEGNVKVLSKQTSPSN